MSFDLGQILTMGQVILILLRFSVNKDSGNEVFTKNKINKNKVFFAHAEIVKNIF